MTQVHEVQPPQVSARDRFSTLLFYAGLLGLGYLLYLILEPFLVPLGWAVILVILFYPWNERLERRWGTTRAAVLSTILVTCVLILPTVTVGTLFVREAFQAVVNTQLAFAQGKMPWVNHAWNWLVIHAPEGTGMDLTSLLNQGGSAIGSRAAGFVSAVVANTATFLFGLFVTLFALFFLFRDGQLLVHALHGFLPFDKTYRDRILNGARDLIRASVITSVVVAAIQGIVCGTAFVFAGIESAVFWGVAMAFCSLVPIIGSAIIWAPAAIWLFSTGHWIRALVVLAMCAGLTSALDSIVRPLILSGRTRLNALLVFISVLGGIAVFGLIGLVLGPIIIATATAIIRAYTGTPRTQSAVT
jgi:predicted PurR-regulated permease PerM